MYCFFLYSIGTHIRQSHGGEDIGITMGYVGIGYSDRVIAGAKGGLGVIHHCNLRDANRYLVASMGSFLFLESSHSSLSVLTTSCYNPH